MKAHDDRLTIDGLSSAPFSEAHGMQTAETRRKSTLVRIITARLNRSFLLLPMVVSLAGLICAILVIALGHYLEDAARLVFPAPDIQTVRSVLSTIAGSALTVLSLVYSLTLVVFTLAAGNISPRLLTRFAEDKLIQTTAGVLAATFFYAVIVLQRADTIPPALSTGVAVLWSIGSISVLIFFIHKVATRITIDEEIGRIGATLADYIDEILEEAEEEGSGSEARDIARFRPHGERRRLIAARSGYIEAVDLGALVGTAAKYDLFVEVEATPGQFIVEGCALANYVGEADEAANTALRRAFLVGRQRTPEADLDFSILLMVEIAQRALSPGVNDSFTAIAVIDHLSSAFARILRRRAPSPLARDEKDHPRVWLETAMIDQLLNSAYHPLRRESAGNITVILRLVASLHRLALVSRPEYRDFLSYHVRLIAEDMGAAGGNAVDRDEVLEGCAKVLGILEESDAA
ncbi:putative membrane protein [Breoghania corrubedonensis]|uniref:Putative membrane protein n=1 Tax=Breoghania corrubedonensis TaxID=665038 RepID=A0A2T5VGQ9_9HYPH|nr:DUF2254 domain-containing protein [Breoghania corrubedonensis]PTW62930.1 putative membrane protein [Breoghania corrubedonensis]